MESQSLVETLNVDPVLVDVRWRENIHVELLLDLTKTLDGQRRERDAPISLIELEHDRTRGFLRDVVAIAKNKKFRAEIQKFRAKRPLNSLEFEPVRFLVYDAGKLHFLEPEILDEGLYKISINITNFASRKAMPNGSWFIVPVFGETVGAPATMLMELNDRLTEFSKNFIYDGNHAAYTVSFRLTEDEFRPKIKLLTYQFGRKRAVKKLGFLARQKQRFVGKDTRHKVLNKIYVKSRRNRLTDKPTIVFASEARTRLEGNLKAVYERMLARGLDEKFHIEQHFMLPESRNFESRIDQVKKIASADYLVIDDYFTSLETLKIDKSTQVIQAWHAGVGFKAVGYARFGQLGSPKLSSPHRKYTWAIAGSTKLVSTYSDVFGIEKEAILPTGLPRIDSFLSDDGRQAAIARFTAAHPEVNGRRVVLFAPTFRGRGIKDAYYDYSRIDFDSLYEYCGEDTVVAFRMHHFVDQPIEIRPEHADRFIDLSGYEDGLGLLHSTDILISDYSSIIYEFSLLDRPMMFFAYDRDLYSATRGFQQNYTETAPGKVCLTFDDLLKALSNEDFEIEKVEKFRDENFDYIDTGSSDRFIDAFFLGQKSKVMQ